MREPLQTNESEYIWCVKWIAPATITDMFADLAGLFSKRNSRWSVEITLWSPGFDFSSIFTLYPPKKNTTFFW
jgi:hypothetical protein